MPAIDGAIGETGRFQNTLHLYQSQCRLFELCLVDILTPPLQCQFSNANLSLILIYATLRRTKNQICISEYRNNFARKFTCPPLMVL